MQLIIWTTLPRGAKSSFHTGFGIRLCTFPKHILLVAVLVLSSLHPSSRILIRQSTKLDNWKASSYVDSRNYNPFETWQTSALLRIGYSTCSRVITKSMTVFVVPLPCLNDSRTTTPARPHDLKNLQHLQWNFQSHSPRSPKKGVTNRTSFTMPSIVARTSFAALMVPHTYTTAPLFRYSCHSV